MYFNVFCDLELSLPICACLTQADPLSDGRALHIMTNSSSKGLPSTEKSHLCVQVVTPASLLGEDVFYLPQDISNRICASHAPCEVKAAAGKALGHSLQGSGTFPHSRTGNSRSHPKGWGER